MRDRENGDRTSNDAAPDSEKLVLCVPAGWEKYISLEFHEIQKFLVKCGWLRVVVDEDDDAHILSAISDADVVIMWETYEFIDRNLFKLSCVGNAVHRYFFCDDVHYFTPGRRQQRLRAFQWANQILATYPDKLRQWYPEVVATNVRWMPHAAASYFRPGKDVSSDKVLLSGSCTWPYPFRQFCRAKLPASVCDVIDHPGYPGYPGDKSNLQKADPSTFDHFGQQRYAALLQMYPAMLACGSIFGYLVAKVFEAMATGCLVIAERASLGARLHALGFVEGEDYVATDVFNVIEDATRVCHGFMQGDLQLRRVVANARNKVVENHTTFRRAAQIHHLCIDGVAK